MPQEFHVLQCYNCFTFQVHQVKKSSNKWNCKLCGEKQSIKKVFGRGSGADCRHHVQKLNSLRQESDEIQSVSVCHGGYPDWENKEQEVNSPDHKTDHETHNRLPSNTESRWNQYIEDAPLENCDEIPEPEDDTYTTDANIFNNSRKRKRKTGSFSKKYLRHQKDMGVGGASYLSSNDEDLQQNNQPSISNSSSPRDHIFQQQQVFRSHSNPALTKPKSSLQEFGYENKTSFLSSTDLNGVHGEEFGALGTVNVKQKTVGDSPKRDPVQKKKGNPTQTCKSTGSKWDQFIEEDESSHEDSEEEQENVYPVGNAATGFQQRNSLSKNEDRVNQGLFSIDDLEDSDFQI